MPTIKLVHAHDGVTASAIVATRKEKNRFVFIFCRFYYRREFDENKVLILSPSPKIGEVAIPPPPGGRCPLGRRRGSAPEEYDALR